MASQSPTAGPSDSGEGIYRSLFEHSLNGVAVHEIVTDGDGRPVDYVFLEVNRAFERLTGLSSEEVVGRRVTEVIPGIEDEPWIEIYGRVALTGEPISLEARLSEALGSWFRVVAFRTDPGRFAAIFVDVTRERQARTEREQLYRQLRESEATLRAVSESSPDHVMMLDLDGTIRFINRTLPGLTVDDVVGRSTFEFVPDRFVSGMRAALRAATEHGEVAEFVTVYDQGEGPAAHFECRAGPVLRDGEVVALVVNATDVTERKQLEAQLRQSQRMEAVGRLAGGVAHDFNNLLTGIHGYTELLLAGMRDEPAARRDLEQVRMLSERAAELTRRLLAFSRRQTLEPVVQDLNELVREAASMIRLTLGDGVELRLALAGGELLLRADTAQLEQVLLNLAANASDAMPDGGALDVRTLRTVSEAGLSGDVVVLEVQDDGEGMDEQTRDRIFEPFFTTKEVGKGTGLGLATVYGIVRQHGGRVRCDSAPGVGTTFRMSFPAAVAEVLDEAAAPPPGDLGAGNRTVLLVEDEDSVRQVAQGILVRHGFRVYTAAGPVAAESIFERHGDDIDLVITAVVMPDLDGVELFRRLQSRKPSLLVLYISGHAENVLVHETLEGVHERLLRKPFDAGALIGKVRQLLKC